AFNVHPVLIGIGDAKDPLSANNTYAQIEDKFILNIAVPRVKWILESLTRQWVQPDFTPWGKLKLIPDLSEISAASKSVPERSQTAVANVERFWTVDESRDYTGRDKLPFPAIQLNPDWALAIYREGGMKRSRLQSALGIEVDTMADGYIWEVDPRI